MKQYISLAMVALIVAVCGCKAGRADAQLVAPLSGVLGQIQSVANNSIGIQTKSGLVAVGITEPLTTYRQVPSDLKHVTSDSYIGVASEEHADGTQVAKQIFIFPTELRGAAEGSVLLESAPGEANRSRMTNGSISQPAVGEARSRMTNGVVQQGDSAILVVQYQGGSQRISVPVNVPVTQVVPAKVTLEAGDAVYAATTKQVNGALTTDKIFVVSERAAEKTK
jgi:hypothetical protein